MIGMNTFGNKVDRTQQDMPTKHLIEEGFGPYSGFGGDGGIIYDMATDAQGKIYVCGEFFKYNGTPCSKLIRLNSDLTLDTTFNYQLGWGDSITETGRINMHLAPDGPAYPGYGVSGDHYHFKWQRVRHYNSTLDAVVHGIHGNEEYWATQAAPRSISILDNGNLVVGYWGIKNIEKRTRVEMGSEVPPTSQQHANFETFYHSTSTDQNNFGAFHPQEAANGTRMISWTYTNFHNRSSFFIVNPNTATMASDWDSFGWRQSWYGHTATVWDNTIWYNNDWKANISTYWDGDEDNSHAKLARAYHGFGDFVLKTNGNSIFTKNTTPFNLSFKRWDCDTGNVHVMEPITRGYDGDRHHSYSAHTLPVYGNGNTMAIDSRGHFFAVGGFNQDHESFGWNTNALTAANGNLVTFDGLVEWDTNGALVQPQNRRFKSYITHNRKNKPISLEIDSNDNFYFITSDQRIVTNAWQDISRFANSSVLINGTIEPYYSLGHTRNPNTFAVEYLRINEQKYGATSQVNGQSFIVMSPTGNVITHKALVNPIPPYYQSAYTSKWGDTMKYLYDQNLLIISTNVKRISTTNPASSDYVGAHVYLDKDGIEINNTDAYLEDAEDWAHNFLVWDIDNSTWMTEFFGDDRVPATSSKVFSKRRVNSSTVDPRGFTCATGNGPTGFVVGGDFSQYNDTDRNLLVGFNLQGEATSPIGRNTVGSPTAFGFLQDTDNPFGYVTAMAKQADGKILVAGYFSKYNGVSVKHLARLNADLTLDTSFDPVGAAVDTDGITLSKIDKIYPLSDGRIILTYPQTTGGFINSTATSGTGRSNRHPGFVVLSSDGSLDSSHATYRQTYIDEWESATGNSNWGLFPEVSLVKNDEFLIQTYQQPYILHFTTTGTKKVNYTVGRSHYAVAKLYDIKLDSNGKLWAVGPLAYDNASFAGGTSPRNLSFGGVWTWNSNGTRDTSTFRGGFFLNSNFTRTYPKKLEIDSNDNLILFGINYGGNSYKPLIKDGDETSASHNRFITVQQNGSLVTSNPNQDPLAWTNKLPTLESYSTVLKLDNDIWAIADNILGQSSSFSNTKHWSLVVVDSSGNVNENINGGPLTAHGSSLSPDNFLSASAGDPYAHIVRINSIIQIDSDSILVGGQFTIYDGVFRNMIIQFNTSTGAVETPDEATITEPWTPETFSSSPVAWIDASDSSNYATSGTTLTSVTDKAGTYTMDVGGTPTVVTGGLNSLNVFDFDGNEYLQSTTYEAQVSNGDHWAIGVFRYEGTDSTQDTLWSYETNQSIKTDYAISSGGSSNSWPGELDLDGLSSNRISTTIGNKEDWNIKGLVRNQYHIVACWFNKTGNQIGVRVDGSNAFTPVNDYDENVRQNQELRLMRNRSKQELDGKMGEFIAFATIPGTSGTDLTHLEKAEGYLAHKWGLTGSLPSNHAYKNTRPTT